MASADDSTDTSFEDELENAFEEEETEDKKAGKYVLKKKEDHRHTVTLDEKGEGTSSTDEGHNHKIEDWKCQPAGDPEHVHDITPATGEYAYPPPKEKDGDAGLAEMLKALNLTEEQWKALSEEEKKKLKEKYDASKKKDEDAFNEDVSDNEVRKFFKITQERWDAMGETVKETWRQKYEAMRTKSADESNENVLTEDNIFSIRIVLKKNTDTKTDTRENRYQMSDSFDIDSDAVSLMADGTALLEKAPVATQMVQEFQMEDGSTKKLLKDEGELKKAAKYADGAHICDGHPVDKRPVTQKDCLGKMFNTNYTDSLRTDLYVWPGPLADAVKAGKRPKASIGYDCAIDWTPGELDGVAYDGVQRDFVINHVALLDADASPRCTPEDGCRIPGQNTKKDTDTTTETDEIKKLKEKIDELEKKERCDCVKQIHAVTKEDPDELRKLDTKELKRTLRLINMSKDVTVTTKADAEGKGSIDAVYAGLFPAKK